MMDFITFDANSVLGITLLHSIWQGFVIMAITMAVVYNLPKQNPEARYETAIFGLFSYFITSMLTYIYFYSTASNIYYVDLITTNKGRVNSLSPVIETSHGSSQVNIELITTLWMAGLVILLVRFAYGARCLYLLDRKALPNVNTQLTAISQNLKQKLNIDRAIVLKVSEQVKSAFTYGFIKPVIIWPACLLNQLSEEEITFILAHELAHIKRMDFLVKLLVNVVATLFYYHPFIWWANKFIEEERECACDQMALQLTKNSLDYARTLVKLQENNLGTLQLHINSFSNKNSFSNRIKRLFNMPINNSINKSKLTILLLCFSGVAMMAYNSHIKKDNAEETSFSNIYVPQFAQKNVNPTDTIEPRSKSSSRSTSIITKIENGKSTTVKIEDGKVQEVEVDGKKLEGEELDQYQKEYGGRARIGMGRRGNSNIQLFNFEGNDMGFPEMGNLENLDSMVHHITKNMRMFKFDDMGGNSFGFSFGDNESEMDTVLNYDISDLIRKRSKNLRGFEFPQGDNDVRDGVMPKFRWEEKEIERDMQNLDRNKNEARVFEFLDNKSSAKNLEQTLGDQLNKDGFLSTTKVNKIELSSKYLKINGEKMPQVIFEKYKNLFEAKTGMPLNNGTTLKFNMEGKDSGKNRSYRAF